MACLRAIEESNLCAQDAEFASYFLLHEIKTHCQQRQADEEIQRTEDHPALRIRVQTLPGYIVTETDRAECDETEIEADEVAPSFFDKREQHRTERDIEDHQQQADVTIIY